MPARPDSFRGETGNIILLPSVLKITFCLADFGQSAPLLLSLTCSFESTDMILTNTNSPATRGAFVVFEGVDRCGKTTQTALLVKRLVAAGLAATLMRFPDRTTATGTLIDSYLASGANLDDRAVHLLFSANRWESTKHLTRQLELGTTVISDRYAYSGVAFSASKVDANDKQALSMNWCQAPDRGLPAPDCVIFLDLSQEEAEKRGG